MAASGIRAITEAASSRPTWISPGRRHDAAEIVTRRFVSFDGTETVAGGFARPDRYRDLFEVLSRPASVIPRGAGLSYCCASAGEGVVAVSSLLFDRVLAFDRGSGVIMVEPGLRVGTLHDVAVAAGWYPPVLPGHPRITVGGCVGFDVHGKSGACFRDSVRELTVFHPEWGEVRCSPQDQPELFDLTVGGFGLTGFVTSVTLQLVPLAGGGLERHRLPVANLVAAIETIERCEGTHCFVYSWNDLTRNGQDFGRGIVYAESFTSEGAAGSDQDHDLTPESRRALGPPWLNRLTIGAANRIYDSVERLRGSARLDLRQGSFPIQGRELYFQLLGRRGFREYQMLVPRCRFETVAEGIEAAIHDSGARCTLGSLKLLDASPGMLRFAGKGVAVALDVGVGETADRLFLALDRVVQRVGGIVNLAKDSRLTASAVAELFPGYEAFRAGLRALGGDRLDSALRRRLLV